MSAHRAVSLTLMITQSKRKKYYIDFSYKWKIGDTSSLGTTYCKVVLNSEKMAIAMTLNRSDLVESFLIPIKVWTQCKVKGQINGRIVADSNIFEMDTRYSISSAK